MKIGWIRFPNKLYKDGSVVRGGSEIANQSIIDYLREQGCEVVEFSPLSKERIDLINLPALGTPLMFQELILRKEELNQCDLVITTNWFGAVLPEIKKPLVTIFHHNARWVIDSVKKENITNNDNLTKWLKVAKNYKIGQESFQSERELIIALGEQYFVENSAKIIAVSSKLKYTLTKYYKARAEKISVIYNSLPDDWFEKVKKTYKKNALKLINVTRLPEDYNGFVVKGADRILEIFNQSILPKIWVVSAKKHGYLPLIERYIKNVEFLQNIGHDRVRQHYQKSHIALIAARCESFGLAIAEAMASQNIPICFPVGIAEEVIINNKNGFIVQNPDEALEKIKYLNENPDKAEEIANQAYHTAKERFSLEKNGKLYLKLLNQIPK